MASAVTQTLLLILLIGLAKTAKFPSYVTPCHKNEPDLQPCILDRLDIIKPHLGAGVPELAIPALEPLTIPKIELVSGDFSLIFWDSKMFHLDKFDVDFLNFETEKDHLALKLTFPTVRIECTYEVKGRILFLNLDGKGPGVGNYTNLKVDVDFELERVAKKGKDHWNIKKSTVNANLGKPIFYFENLFGDNKELNEQTLKAVNENIDQFIGDLQPTVNRAISDMVVGILSRLFNKFSIDELFA